MKRFLITVRADDLAFDPPHTHTRYETCNTAAVTRGHALAAELSRKTGKEARVVSIEPNRYRKPRRKVGPRSHGPSPEHQAVIYARWLAAREGIRLPENPASPVTVIWSGVTSKRRAVWERRIQAVAFGLVKVPLPNWDWQPDQPVEEIIREAA